MKKTLLFTFITIIFICGCSNSDDLPIDPNTAIFGKWEITHLGNGDNLTLIEQPIAYEEYLLDSILRVYNYEEKSFYNEKYWIKDSLLFKTYLFIDAVDKGSTVFIDKYKFQFLDENRLRLDFQNPAIFTTSIYKRIN
tara:strand:+ start:99 stop:512 length:414 start_codon:yes stop_codon:yes gene_type:complete